LAKELLPGKMVPTTAHYFSALLQEKGLLLRNYTQNVDNLEVCAKINHCFTVIYITLNRTAQVNSASGITECVYCDRVIFSLQRLAGVKPELMVEAHGSFATSHCIGCKEEYETEFVKKKMFADEIPKCEKCGALIKVFTKLVQIDH
tara:strand:- start:916 stop:1356 length:441 start_codon:yes stop_codon:yes gene_type:complete